MLVRGDPVSRRLHVLNGDAAGDSLRQSGTDGDFTIWADVLHDGPVPADSAGDTLRRVRASHIASTMGHDESDVLDSLRQWDAALDDCHHYDEVIFWLEHDLFDQLILLRHLDWIG